MIGIVERNRAKLAGAAFAAAVIAGLAPSTDAGDRLPRLSSLINRKAVDVPETKPAENDSVMNWWSVPRPARVAAKKLAKSQDASVTRCVAIEREDKVAYEIHASHNLGLFKKDDFVLTSVSEPKATAEKRKEEQTLKGRVRRLREGAKTAVMGETPSNVGSRSNTPGSAAFPVK